MIEAEIEQRIIDKITGLLEDAEVDGVQVVGSLQVSEIKAVAESGMTSYVVVKASPRQYSTPTIPECTIECGLSLTVRADMDYNGKTYLDLSDLLMKQFESWQKCQDDAHDDFTLDDFNMTGFVLGNGTTTIDHTAVAFQYSHNFTIYGIVV